MLGHEIEHPAGQLVVVDPRVPRRGDGVDGPRFVAVDEELLLLATLTAQPVVDRVGRDLGGQRPEVFGGAAAMPASCSKLQFVRAAWRPDVSRSASASDATASVLSATVSMVRSSVRRRRARPHRRERGRWRTVHQVGGMPIPGEPCRGDSRHTNPVHEVLLSSVP